MKTPRAKLAPDPGVHPLARPSTYTMGADRSLRGRTLIGAGVLIIVGGVALLGYYGGVFGGKEQAQPVATPSAARTAAPDGAITVTEQQMQLIKLGRVEARSFWVEKTAVGQIALNEDVTTPVFTPYAGRVTRLFAKPGDAVNKGDPLFEIDSPDLVQAESTLISAAGTLQKARSQLDLATRAVRRQRQLFEAKATAQKDLDQAEADFRGAETDFRSTTGALAAAQDAVRIFGKTDAEINRIREQRRVDSTMAVYSPIGGTVVARKAGPGQFVQPSNADAVYTIADLTKMWLIANVGELDIPFVHLGDEVTVKVAAYPQETFRARITNIGAAVDPTTRRITVRSELEPKGYMLKPQMFATFRIITEAGQPTAAVPTSALTRDSERTLAWVQIAPRQFVMRTIQRGVDQEGMTQVLSGLTAGETVATEGGVFLSNVEAIGKK
ncbi:MAG: efflux RND transporter periplasmic adaptor subunit [Proteobacteria bacterium]|nr:efflux RND transporter periplasmic adaptor subunit [Pseudomonadota bacterium]